MFCSIINFFFCWTLFCAAFSWDCFLEKKKEADRHVAPTINRAHLLASSVLTISLSLSPSHNIIFAHNSLALKEKKTNFPSRYRVARATRSDLEEITSWTITLKLKPRYYTLISSLSYVNAPVVADFFLSTKSLVVACTKSLLLKTSLKCRQKEISQEKRNTKREKAF